MLILLFIDVVEQHVLEKRVSIKTNLYYRLNFMFSWTEGYREV